MSLEIKQNKSNFVSKLKKISGLLAIFAFFSFLNFIDTLTSHINNPESTSMLFVASDCVVFLLFIILYLGVTEKSQRLFKLINRRGTNVISGIAITLFFIIHAIYEPSPSMRNVAIILLIIYPVLVIYSYYYKKKKLESLAKNESQK